MEKLKVFLLELTLVVPCFSETLYITNPTAESRQRTMAPLRHSALLAVRFHCWVSDIDYFSALRFTCILVCRKAPELTTIAALWQQHDGAWHKLLRNDTKGCAHQ